MDPITNNSANTELMQHQVDTLNRGLGRNPNQEMGQDAFLRLLVEQLKNQDPTDPVKDKEFIAQMAQFNSLEQMIALNKNFKELGSNLGQNQALSLLGKEVSVSVGRDRNGEEILQSGRVTAVLPGNPVKLSVAGGDYPLAAVRKISP